VVISTAKGKLTKKKKAVAELLAAPSQLSIADVCAKEQLTLADLCRLFDEKAFVDYLHRLIEGYSEGSLAAVWDALIEKCRSGDMRAIKLYFELKGGLKAAKDLSNVVITGADDLE